MALRDPRFTKFRIDWHRGDPVHGPSPDGTPQWYATMGGVVVATAVMTGRSGVDDYPWDWGLEDAGKGLQTRPGKTQGVTDTLRSAKEYVLAVLTPRTADPAAADPCRICSIGRGYHETIRIDHAWQPIPTVDDGGLEIPDDTVRRNGPIVIGQRCPWCGDMVTGPDHSMSHD